MLVGSLALIALGIVLLLQNFLLLADFNVGAFAPLILVILGAIILLRGDCSLAEKPAPSALRAAASNAPRWKSARAK